MINASKLSERMSTLDITVYEVSEVLGYGVSLASRKLYGLSPMTLDDAEKLQKLLKIEDEDFGSYFFA